MAGDGKKLQPIIIKRIKKGGHAAHGGAWKIAYADFVTAMMAFFLLMWLLGSTSKGELQGIASYFQNPMRVTLIGGNGTGNSNAILPGGGRDLSKASGQVDGGDAERAEKKAGAQLADVASDPALTRAQDARQIEQLQQKLTELVASNPVLAEFSDQIQMMQTDDGLQIQIVDGQNRPMFDSGSALVRPHMRTILREIGATLADVRNKVALSGHTDATPYSTGDSGYSNWELSTDRANASRRELVAGGLPANKMARVEGVASSQLLIEDDPLSPANRRISLLVMTREAEQRLMPSSRPKTITPIPELQIPLNVSKPTDGRR